MSSPQPLVLTFDRGTLLLEDPLGESGLKESMAAPWVFDARVGQWRAPAIVYRDILRVLHRGDRPYRDDARSYTSLSLTHDHHRTPHPHQAEALAAWVKGGRRGVLVLPTGSGKSFLAELAIHSVQRSTLVLAPTLDLMNQWYDLLSQSFGVEIGLVGGGYHEVRDLTVTTYDSAYIHMERYGGRFGLLVFDECHHLPGPSYTFAAESAIAPFRLGLTATPERSDGRESLLDRLIGPITYEKGIRDMTGRFLAEYEVVRILVDLHPDDMDAYHDARETYRNFVRSRNIYMGQPGGFQRFIMLSAGSKEGRDAMKAFRLSRQIALAAPAKLEVLEMLLRRHRRDRVIIFTHENDMVYQVSRRFLIPSITHRTDSKERKRLLTDFREGRLPALVTSRVLNEGVDLPIASVGIIMSGSGSIREHVQRLGRLLRQQEGKEASLYELISRGTMEERVSERRRDHDAYKGGGDADS